MIGVVDYGMGNLASVRNALDFLGAESELVADPAGLDRCERAILPGVGAFGRAMRSLTDTGMDEALREYAGSDRPLMGICLGMQLLLSSSREHGLHQGLGLAAGTVEPLAESADGLRVPNIGWCRIQAAPSSRLLSGLEPEDLCFYFVHSFYCRLEDRSLAAGTLNYGAACDVVLEAGNLYGCQFHPEKSQKAGLSVLTRFLEAPCS